jgi:hypothetical protein
MLVARHAATLVGVSDESQKQIRTSIKKSVVGCKCRKNGKLTSVMGRGDHEAKEAMLVLPGRPYCLARPQQKKKIYNIRYYYILY